MTTSDVLYLIADILVAVLVFFYDRRIEELEEKCTNYESQLRTMRRRLDSLAERTPPLAGEVSG